MRIIAGQARGRRLKSPPGKGVRPTRDAVREALFSILGPLDGIVVVDGFGGSGALGLEALSRGAERAYFFEPSRLARQTIEENIARVDVASQVSLYGLPFEEGIKRLEESETVVDLFFLDPPYMTDLGERALAAILAAKSVWHADTLVVFETSTEREVGPFSGWDVEDDRRYGTSRLLFLRAL